MTPSYRDTVVFDDPTKVNADLTLDGLVEVEGVVIEARDYGVTRRDFATPGAGGPSSPAVGGGDGDDVAAPLTPA